MVFRNRSGYYFNPWSVEQYQCALNVNILCCPRIILLCCFVVGKHAVKPDSQMETRRRNECTSLVILIVSFPDGKNTRSWGRWRAEQSAIKPSAFWLAVRFLSCWSCAVLAHFSVQSNWRECAGRGKVLRWLLPLSRCQQLLLCIELYKELRSSQINTELWLCPWHIVTALIIYPCSFLLATCSSWLFKVMLPHVGYSRKGVKNKGKLGFNLSSVKG